MLAEEFKSWANSFKDTLAPFGRQHYTKKNTFMRYIIIAVGMSVTAGISFVYTQIKFNNSFYDHIERAFYKESNTGSSLAYYTPLNLSICIFPDLLEGGARDVKKTFLDMLESEFKFDTEVTYVDEAIDCKESNIYISVFENRIFAESLAQELQYLAYTHGAYDFQHDISYFPGGHHFSLFGYFLHYYPSDGESEQFSYVAIGLAKNETISDATRDYYINGVITEELFHAVSHGVDIKKPQQHEVQSILEEPIAEYPKVTEEKDIKELINTEIDLMLSSHNMGLLCLYDLMSLYLISHERSRSGLDEFHRPSVLKTWMYRKSAERIISRGLYSEIISPDC